MNNRDPIIQLPPPIIISFLPTADDKLFPFLFQKFRMSREFCRSFTESFRRLFGLLV